ncbi:hypothetical protein IFT68_02525 [Oxalobacteraceae sp. CFBP 13730]|nr:hypothetical protein [Oxalobacteraceae sp. CFBP 13730]
MNMTKKFIAQSVLVGLFFGLLVYAYEYIYGQISTHFFVRALGIGIFCGFASVTFLSIRNKKGLESLKSSRGQV